MSKIIQFSNIGTLMVGYFEGLLQFPKDFKDANFGIGCTEDVNGELTVFEGVAYEATAYEDVHVIASDAKIPFIQVTNFKPQQQELVQDVNHLNAQGHLNKFITIQNIFVALSFSGKFSKVKLRTPLRATAKRTIEELHSSQLVTEHKDIKGTLIGFWTPEIFARISVGGFHFHFLDDSKTISGHVLEFSAKELQLSFQEKQGYRNY